MANLLALILALATTTAVLEARTFEVYEKHTDLDDYVSDQRANSYNDYAERRERGFGQRSGSFGQQTGVGQRPSVYGAVGQQPIFGQQTGFGQRPSVYGAVGQQTGFGHQHNYGKPTAVYQPNTGFGQQTRLARQYPGVYTPNRQVTHLSAHNGPGGHGYGYDAYGR